MNEEELQRLRVGSKQEMQQGIALLGQGEWRAALGHFDRAVALRESFPWREDGESAWLLAAAWINRSDALRQLGDERLLPEAIRSLDRGIEAMGHVPLDGDPMFAERLILAWINRATACGDAGRTEESLAGFAEAENVLETHGRDVTPTRRFLAAMATINRARVLLDAGRVEDGWREAAAGVAALRPQEPGDGLIAQTGIRARAVLCRALALLAETPEGTASAGDWIATATDAAEEALAIVKRSGLHDPAVPDLVRYGARIYRVCQPQFLAEFIHEWVGAEGPLAGDPGLREEMQGVILLARAEAETRLRTAPHDDEVAQRELRILRTLEL
ncbi:hypothetical protein [Luteolibacter sp. LG18]|uniref:hypothetical protein n=1 Tax=Luteolibacter sp. LG18 TaxID=2819286 RepID=UPI002B2CEDDB|nr:hypothetical protein llg_20320 [Luteolibacter sp. LG18]